MKLYKKINKADLIDYLQSVKDTNSLHYGKNPIIPGNFFIIYFRRDVSRVLFYAFIILKSKFLLTSLFE